MDEIEHDQCHGEALVTPEGDAAIARKVLAEGDVSHALFHVAGALAVKPREPAYLELLEEVLASVPDPLALTEREGGDWFALFAVRAFALRRDGRPTEALEVLLRVLAARPDSPFDAWLEDWIARDDYDPSLVARYYDRTMSGVEKTDLGRRYGNHLRGRLLETLEIARGRHPEEPTLARTHARLLRVLRRFDEALAIADAVEARERDYESALLIGTIHRERGAREEGVAWFERAAERRDDDWAIRLDIGDTYLDLARWDDAIAAYEAALARDAGNAWASASIPYARFRKTGALEDREAIEAHARAHPKENRAQSLVARVTPFLGHLPNPREACIAAVQPLWNGDTTAAPLTMASTALEAPSAITACDDAMRLRGFAPPRRSASAKLDPDPRAPIETTAFTLWTYDGVAATPALPEPPEDVAKAVADLAVQRFGIVPWCRQAEATGQHLGVGAIEALLGAMVHPPPMPEGWAPWYWRQQVVIAAGLVVAFVETGWPETGRRAALRSLLFGPVDWTTTAGIVAMTELAYRGGPPRDEALEWFARLEALPMSPSVYENVALPLVECMLQLDFLDADRLEALRARRRDLLA